MAEQAGLAVGETTAWTRDAATAIGTRVRRKIYRASDQERTTSSDRSGRLRGRLAEADTRATMDGRCPWLRRRCCPESQQRGGALAHRQGVSGAGRGQCEASVRSSAAGIAGPPTSDSSRERCRPSQRHPVVPRTLVDLATALDEIAIERAVNEADKRDLIDPETLRSALSRYEGEPGVRVLRKLLDKRTFRLSDSALEILFRPIAAEAGLPFPLSKQIVNGWEVDFYWPDLGLVVETDGLRYHRTASTQTRDARRDRAHALAGMTPLRFTHYEIKHEPAVVRAELSRAAALLHKRIRY